MNIFRTRKTRIASSIAVLVLIGACSGGGGNGVAPTFSVFSMDPAESLDLDGGDDVIIHGEKFIAARVAQVQFGGSVGFNMQILDDTRIQVTVPPSPGNQPGIVAVDVITLERGTKGVTGGFRYNGPGGPTGPPIPQTITPTNFSATGAEQFTIGGTNLGPGGGTVTVQFAGIGAVVATVSSDSTIVRGRAPVSPGIPPAGLIQVVVDNNGEAAAVPTQVNYLFTSPVAMPVPNQEGLDNASRPVRVGDGLAVMATGGVDFAWGNGNDDLVLIQGPPNTIQTLSLLAGQGAGLRNLDRNNSIPIALDNDTILVYSPGPSAALGDEIILLITNLTTTPTVTALPAANAMSTPIARLSANRFGFILRGTGTTGQDQLQIHTINNGVLVGGSPAPVNVGIADRNGIAGRTNRSIPFTTDGDAVFVYSSGGNGTFGDLDDGIYRYEISTARTTMGSAPFLLQRPMAISGTRVVGLAGPQVNPPDPDDSLAVFDINAISGVFGRAYHDLGSLVDAFAPRPMALLGTGNIVILTGGLDRAPNNADDELTVFTDDGSGTLTQVTVALGRRPTLAPLGGGDMVAFGRGPDLVAGTTDDRTVRILADGSVLQNFLAAPAWSPNVAPLSDSTRVFGFDFGLDLAPSTGDERLLVYQTSNFGNGTDGSVLPMSIDFNNPVTSTAVNPIVFVPVGPGWGVIQSPGRNNGFLSLDDQILIVTY